MIDLGSSFFAQNFDNWIEGAIILLIVVISALGSAGKWIVQQIELKRQRDALRRTGTQIDERERPVYRTDDAKHSGLPPIAIPIPPETPPARRPPGRAQPPVMERVMEILLEKTTGTTMERRVREIAEQVRRPAPPPPPDRSSERRARKQTAKRIPAAPGQSRPMTVAEREARRDQIRQTEVERETQRVVEREQQFTDHTDQRLGRVETHIEAAGAASSESMNAFDIAGALADPDAVQKAFILSEILAPPLALRNGVLDSYN